MKKITFFCLASSLALMCLDTAYSAQDIPRENNQLQRRKAAEAQEAALTTLQQFQIDIPVTRQMRESSNNFTQKVEAFNNALTTYIDNSLQYTRMDKEFLEELRNFELKKKSQLNEVGRLVDKILEAHRKIQ
ncbi:MAG: hypothetical protein K2X98_06175 [Alphaproteobacteria bacterium]|nr:hypothetical protein [Alphaproteobacteria bacterium]